MVDLGIDQLTLLGAINDDDVTPFVPDGTLIAKSVKASAVKAYVKTGMTKADVGLDQVDNTSDVNKPVSTAQATAIGLKVNTSDLPTVVPANETDPVYSASQAANITATDITNLGNLSGTNSGDNATNSQYSGLAASKLDKNAPITGATKTKITYDANGLVTSGADATCDDIIDGTNTHLVTTAQQTVINNTSGTNTGDQVGDGVTITGAGTIASPFVATGTGGGHIIQDEGNSLTQRSKLNFVGAGVVASDGGAGLDSTIVTIPADMVLNGVQAVTGKKTFDKDKLEMKGTGAGVNIVSVANTSGTSYTNILPAADGTVALTSDITADTSHLKLDQGTPQTITGGQPIQDVLTASELVATGATKKLESLPVASYPSLAEIAHVKGVTSAIQTQLNGKSYFHGVYARPTISPLPTNLTTTTFTLAANTTSIIYYYLGQQVTVSTQKTATLDDGLGGTSAGLYYVYFNGATGNILATKTFPGITNVSNVIIASVYWNGSNYGVVCDERHAYDRDHERHVWAHDTIGCRYESGLGFSFAGTTIANTTFAITTGAIHDEDIDFSVSGTSCRIWYQTGASTYSFDATLSATPYKKDGSGIQAVNSANYQLVTITSSNRYFNYWMYASTSCLAPIHVFCETTATTGGYTSVANARAVSAPSLAGFGLSPEWKLIYRIVVNGAGLVQTPVAADDYRTTSTVSGGALTTVTASSVTENNYGNVQTAINTILAQTAGYTTTPTAAGTTTLTSASTHQQFFTGTDVQTVVLPVVSTLTLGTTYTIVNQSTGAVAVQSSGTNVIVILAGGTQADFTSIAITGTDTSVWYYEYEATSVASAKKLTVTDTASVSGTNTGDQTLSHASDGTSHTVTLSASGGSLKLIEGNNITLTTSSNEVTIASTASGGGAYNPVLAMVMM